MLLPDHGAIVELLSDAYSADLEEDAWDGRVLDVLKGICGGDSGAAFRLTSSFAPNGSLRVSVVGGVKITGERTRWNVETAKVVTSSAMAERSFGRTQGLTASEASGLGPDIATVAGWRSCFAEPIVDSLGLVSRDAHGDIFCATIGLTTTQTVTPREGRLLTKLASHLGSADWLRRTRGPTLLERADAVLAPNGKLLHANDTTANARDAVDDGVQRRAHAQTNRHDAEKALEVWKGLVAGRWSLVDFFDTDGKRFLLAVKNTPQVDRRRDLTLRERRVTALAAMGHRDKEIAYMLGLTLPSVTTALRRSRVKLGADSRAELATVWRRGHQ